MSDAQLLYFRPFTMTGLARDKLSRQKHVARQSVKIKFVHVSVGVHVQTQVDRRLLERKHNHVATRATNYVTPQALAVFRA